MLFCPISDINWIVEKAVVCRMHYRNHINLNTSFNVTYCRSLSVKPFVVYFDQFLGAAHPKSWLKSSFSAKKMRKNEKNEKKQEICSKILSTCCVFSPALGCCSFHTLYI